MIVMRGQAVMQPRMNVATYACQQSLCFAQNSLKALSMCKHLSGLNFEAESLLQQRPCNLDRDKESYKKAFIYEQYCIPFSYLK